MLTSRDTILAASGAPGIDAPLLPRHPVRTTFRRLRMAGLTPTEAGNLTAHLAGLHAHPAGWRIEELERLLFVRELARQGRIGS